MCAECLDISNQLGMFLGDKVIRLAVRWFSRGSFEIPPFPHPAELVKGHYVSARINKRLQTARDDVFSPDASGFIALPSL